MVDIAEQLAPVLAAAAAHADFVDTEGTFPEASVEALRNSGLMGLTLPENVGGAGAGPVEFSDVLQQIAGVCGSTAMIYLMHVAAAMPIASSETGDFSEVLTGMASGELLGTLAFSEKGSRSHFWAPVSRERRDGGAFTIEAEKSWVTSADHAQVFVVSTLTHDAVSSMESNLYLVRKGAPGLAVASPWTGLGLRGNESSPMMLATVVTDEDRIGKPGSGFGTMMQVVLPWFNLGNGSVTLGLARSALDAAVRHVSGARFEHLDARLADLPTIRHRLGRAGTLLAAQQEYIRATARKIADPDESTILYVLGSRAAANDAALEITDEAMRVCGGAAFSKHLPIERAFRDARAGHVMAPTSDVLYDFYGKAMCGMDLF